MDLHPLRTIHRDIEVVDRVGTVSSTSYQRLNDIVMNMIHFFFLKTSLDFEIGNLRWI